MPCDRGHAGGHFMNPWECIARDIYEYTRGKSAFNVTFMWPIKSHGKNQHGGWYKCEDGSVFIVYAFGRYAYRGKDGLMYARRTDYSGYGLDPRHTVEFGKDACRSLGC